MVIFIRWTHTPSQAVISPAKTTDQARPAERPQNVQTKQFTTQIPAGFRATVTESPRDSSITYVSAISTKDPGTQIGITSEPLPSDGLDGISGYLYRVRSPDIYDHISLQTLPKGTPVFRAKSGTPETTSFLVHSNRCVVIAITSASQEVENTLETITKNWQWL